MSTLQSRALQPKDGKKPKKKPPPKKKKPKQVKANGYPNEKMQDMLIADESIEMAAIEGGLEVGSHSMVNGFVYVIIKIMQVISVKCCLWRNTQKKHSVVAQCEQLYFVIHI